MRVISDANILILSDIGIFNLSFFVKATCMPLDSLWNKQKSNLCVSEAASYDFDIIIAVSKGEPAGLSVVLEVVFGFVYQFDDFLGFVEHKTAQLDLYLIESSLQ